MSSMFVAGCVAGLDLLQVSVRQAGQPAAHTWHPVEAPAGHTSMNQLHQRLAFIARWGVHRVSALPLAPSGPHAPFARPPYP